MIYSSSSKWMELMSFYTLWITRIVIDRFRLYAAYKIIHTRQHYWCYISHVSFVSFFELFAMHFIVLYVHTSMHVYIKTNYFEHIHEKQETNSLLRMWYEACSNFERIRFWALQSAFAFAFALRIEANKSFRRLLKTNIPTSALLMQLPSICWYIS